MTKIMLGPGIAYIGDTEIAVGGASYDISATLSVDDYEVFVARWKDLYSGPVSACTFSAIVRGGEAFKKLVSSEPAVTELLFRSGRAWFFPEYRGLATFETKTDLDEMSAELTGTFIDPPTFSYQNWLAPIVYWLWRKPWYPMRWLSWRIRQWRNDA